MSQSLTSAVKRLSTNEGLGGDDGKRQKKPCIVARFGIAVEVTSVRPQEERMNRFLLPRVFHSLGRCWTAVMSIKLWLQHGVQGPYGTR